ncbi:hypothetical protein TREMEDRAFT_27758 [Tremella mesenterica DSM 1558]|uniref:uncharacterized protein n=1 Tax=Tremella mesenterica (strain ATCC 24925 / CBS 8224 / DSM 1558 / NBRC 9311 / NRRL Y-6157 / RJB 2259-6 / UBC 559-6) TaxID=578456 RepID=UPI0003F4A038|nr:uncharacterized protein TREMEDRAFT_27758 [Tremella mesenterica DSM 1558]EIW71796.1 hypothetical protein TREMEDRAFT_27758 [Tremella mesenterica DSM 1558]
MQDCKDKIDYHLLIHIAGSLRPGHTCHIPGLDTSGRLKHPPQGGRNAHIPLVFDDDVKWMARVRMETGQYPHRQVNHINLLSEAATVEALSTGGVLVPCVKYRPSSTIGRYSIIHCLFDIDYKDPSTSLFYITTFEEGREKRATIRALTDWYISLEKVSFDKVGSLHYNSTGGIVVGPEITRHQLLPDSPFFLGPFDTVKQRYLALIDKILEYIEQDTWCTPEKVVQEYLIHLEARELVEACEEMDEDGPYYVVHGEPKGDHLLFDGNWNVTSAIDWEWSYLSNKYEAFGAPSLFWNHDFRRDGLNDPSASEREYAQEFVKRGREDLADCVLRRSRKYQRLTDLLREGINFVQCVNAMKRAFLDQSDTYADKQPQTMEEWVMEQKARRKDDEKLRRLLELEMMWREGDEKRRIFVEGKRAAAGIAWVRRSHLMEGTVEETMDRVRLHVGR